MVKRLSLRAAILEREGLTSAPRHIQEGFWLRHNSVLWPRKNPDALSDWLLRAWPGSAGKHDKLLERVSIAWERALPVELAESSMVEGVVGGCLKVLVDCASTKFVLERHLGDGLITRINMEVGSQIVYEIKCRAGRIRGRRKSNDSNKKKISKERQ